MTGNDLSRELVEVIMERLGESRPFDDPDFYGSPFENEVMTGSGSRIAFGSHGEEALDVDIVVDGVQTSIVPVAHANCVTSGQVRYHDVCLDGVYDVTRSSNARVLPEAEVMQLISDLRA